MAIIPWKPFSELDRFMNDDDWFLPVMPAANAFAPAMDVYETDKEVVAKLNAPGFNSENIDVSVNEGVLSVRGKLEEKTEEHKKGYFRKEIRQGSFERAVRLPVAVKEDAVEAVYENGVLKIVMPKIEPRAASKVKIQVKGK